MAQHRITESHELLDKDGKLLESGWATQPLLKFNPSNAGKGWHRCKWWDFYGIVNEDFNFNFALADLGYFSLIGYNFLDFTKPKSHKWGTVKLLTRGNLGLPNSSREGKYTISTRLAGDVTIERPENKHIITLDSKPMQANIELTDDPAKDSMVVATGYGEDPTQFYYNHKKNLIPAQGTLEFKGNTYEITPEDTYGHYDWGRGIWPYKTKWYWATGAGWVDRHEVWFNIGYGFGDLSNHTENMVFYDGKVHKLDKVTFHPSKAKSKEPWQFTSNDNRLNLTLKPIVDISGGMNIGFLMTKSNLVHGVYSGTLILDDGTPIEIEHMHGHAEIIKYRW